MSLPKSQTVLKESPRAVRSAEQAYAIDIVNLSKSFKRKTIGKGGYTTIKSALLGLFRGKKQPSNYTHVLRDLTLRIPRGSSVGVIGRNGSGKSTFLKLITGIYKPDVGKISVNGRLAALIELGAGFHPDFTGRENLYLGGVIHGLTRKEIDDRLPDIIKFAELEEVIDDPVRTYSSGMFMRLGFSLAVHTEPDILLVDEVLAVGDAAFVVKCKERIAKLRKEGRTLVLVTHDLDAVERWCDEVLWISNGEVRERGEPRRVIDAYREFVEKGEEKELESRSHTAEVTVAGEANQDSSEKLRWGSREIEITGVKLVSGEQSAHFVFHPNDPITIEISYSVNESVQDLVFGIGINRADGLVVHGTNTHIEKIQCSTANDSGVVRYQISRIGLADGSYTLDVAAHRKDGYPFDYHKGIVKFSVRSPLPYAGVMIPEHSWSFGR